MQKTLIILSIALLAVATSKAQIGIGTNTPNGKSILDLSSTTKGLLVPRMTTTERIAINPANPARGLLVYDLDSLAYMSWNGTIWQKLEVGGGSGSAWLTTGNNVSAGALLGNLNRDSITIITQSKPVLRAYHKVAGIHHAPNIVLGAETNTVSASAASATIGGGYKNHISASFSTIAGGQLDTTHATFSVIGGGNGNYIDANSYSASISGGSNNKVTNGFFATLSGGYNNEINADHGGVSGGQLNVVDAKYGFIGGGYQNKIWTGSDSGFIGGGKANYIAAFSRAGVIGGGSGNAISAQYASLVGGRQNYVEGDYGFVGGGQNNRVIYNSFYSNIVGGKDNFVDAAEYSTIGGGFKNFMDLSFFSSISGGYKNFMGATTNYGVIAGGDSNRVEAGIANAISGGRKNRVIGSTNEASTIGGGMQNLIEKKYSVIAGGLNNWSRGDYSSVLGGNTNEAGGDYSSVLGGAGNSTQNDYSTVLGGRLNEAWGSYSAAAGYKAKILHASNFVYADFRGSGSEFKSRQNNQVLLRVASGGLITDEDTSTTIRAQWHVRSSGSTPQIMVDQVSNDFARIRFNSNLATANHWDLAGSTSTGTFNIFRNGTGNILTLSPTDATNLMMMSNGARLTIGGTWTNTSDRNVKDQITQIDENNVLDKLAALPISQWHYKNEAETVQHIGPMAQDFKAVFGLGDSDKSITTIDADGINMAAIKALYKKVLALETQNQQLAAEIKALKKK